MYSSPSQIMKLPTMHRGTATINHCAHDGGGDMFWMAMMFCGDEMGDAMPPKLEAKAIPRIRHEPNVESTGSVRKIG